jgi:hypothetical protein
MSKGPDLSAFPIPRKGGARPLDEAEPPAASGRGAAVAAGEADAARLAELQPSKPPAPQVAPAAPARVAPRPPAAPPAAAPIAPPVPAASGQIVATTVKLDEARYLRLAEAGKPGPGRLKRRTIQDMVIEALDEWFARRGL